MSRTWERKVRRNTNQINKNRKKQGGPSFKPAGPQSDRFVGRSYIAPILLLLFIAMYVILAQMDPQFKFDTLLGVTIGCYVFLAIVFFLRRPYITIGKNYVQTRKMTGDKRLGAEAIKTIRVQPGYVTIEPQKGSTWAFSRVFHRYPTDEISARLEQFAKDNGITYEQK
ncbi:hypothetical protein [Paenibacillus sp. Leaf72]|uniref:hypothetical protein n=1 Tax=Paenibacillus sp. Leaf72 TaxID=1736234 RepID=UPI0007015164|nr:hypothetical protein [Paenibacillus sp. Leaf72]KQO00719.1 hypothetical protein ASF12_18390 [Paenibacillus sp. Leaf72]